MRARAGTHGTRASRGLRRARGRPPQRRVRPSSPWERSGRGLGCAGCARLRISVPCAVRREYYRRGRQASSRRALFAAPGGPPSSLDAFWNALLRRVRFRPCKGAAFGLPAVAFSLLGASGGPWKQPAVGLLAPRPLYSRNAGNRAGLATSESWRWRGKTLGTRPTILVVTVPYSSKTRAKACQVTAL